MWSSDGESDEMKLLKGGGEQALATLFSQHRDKLQRMVHFRLDKRLYGRVGHGRRSSGGLHQGGRSD